MQKPTGLCYIYPANHAYKTVNEEYIGEKTRKGIGHREWCIKQDNGTWMYP